MHRNSRKGANEIIMETSSEIIEIIKALNSMQGEMRGVAKDAINPHFKNRYLSLDAVWDSIKLPLFSNGLCVVQDVTSQGSTVSVETRVFHISGQWMKFGPLVMPLGKLDPQSIGSATTYAKRYSLCSALGVVADIDDDGQHAQNSHKSPTDAQKNSGFTNEDASKIKITNEQLLEIEELFRWIDADLAKSIKERIFKKYAINHLQDIPSLFFPMIIKGIKEQTDAKKDES